MNIKEELREIEKELYRYTYYLMQSSYIKTKLANMHFEELSSNISNYSGQPRGTNIRDDTGNTAVKITDIEKALIAEIKLNESRAQYILDLINTLENFERKVVYKKYIEKKAKWEISKEMDRSRSQISKIIKEALKKLEETDVILKNAKMSYK